LRGKSQIPIRTCANSNEKPPRFARDRHHWSVTRAATPGEEFAQTLTVTDVVTDLSETKAVRNKAQKWVIAALVDLRCAFPFPVLGIDSDNGSEFTNAHLPAYREQEHVTFTRSRAGPKNDGACVEQKN
jgi:hypothetical protein